MDESIQLLSSMSPKVKEGYKVAKKGTSVLALKKHFRRSSMFDKKKKTIHNDSLIILESDSANSSDILSLPRHSFIKNNVEPIEISDSELSNDDEAILAPPKVTVPLSKTKIHDIEKWIDKVDINAKPNKSFDQTAFSEVSTIFGDEIGGNFQVEGGGGAVNSTQISTDDRRFDELFKKKKQVLVAEDSEKFNFKIGSQEDVIKKEVNDIDQQLGSLVIDDSFEEDKVDKRNSNDNKKKERRSIDKSVLKENNKQNEGNEDINLEYESVLDSLYGTSWRQNKDHVLPKTEPKKPKPKNVAQNLPKTERKPKAQPSLLRNLQTAKVTQKIESPWVAKLKNLCDPESTSSSPDSTPEKKNQRTKLNFDSPVTKSPYFEKNVTKNDDENKENSFEFEDLGETLEERIRKKLNNEKPVIKKPPKSKKEVKKPASDFKTYRDLYSDTTSSNDSDSLKNVKPVRTKTTKKYIDSDSSGEWSTDKSEKKKIKPAGTKKTTWTFLESLSANAPIDKIEFSVRIFRTNFKDHKEKLAEKLFTLYNKEIFDNALPKDTPIEWNDRMRGSAGFCYCKKITRRTGQVERTVRVVLSTKVLDSADRLRDTLVHELCHAATWLVNNVSDGHGPYWKTWASKAMRRFPELPPIKRCHDYVINTKYTYKCTGCSYSIGRHTKSLDIERKRCGYCHGKFEVLINKTSKKGEIKSVPVTPKREPTAFALFVKENYSQYKTPDRKHGDVMRILGQKFGELKTVAS